MERTGTSRSCPSRARARQVAGLHAVSQQDAVGVLPAWRRCGIAAALIGTLGRAAFDRGVPVLMLMAHQREQAVYARAGFTVASEIIFISTPT